jgi:NADPH:quinone reductase-like Zn-dependent oxidoreductase
MRALNVPAPGVPPRLSELPVPEVTDGQVLIRVKAAGLNPIDNALAAGVMAHMMPHHYPLILGRDAAGTVETVGAGVEHVAPGDEVFGNILLIPPVQAGTLAEYALLPAVSVAEKPANLEFETAAAIPLSGAAAVALIDAIRARSGETVLITGASGGVGSFAIQLLSAAGVTVVATGTPEDLDRLTALGAAHVIDFRTGSVVEKVRVLLPDGVDALIDLVEHDPDALPLGAVRAGGMVASTLAAANEEILEAVGLTGMNVNAGAVKEIIAPLAEKAAAGTLKVGISAVLPFERAAEGLATIARGGARGKIVVKVG